MYSMNQLGHPNLRANALRVHCFGSDRRSSRISAFCSSVKTKVSESLDARNWGGIDVPSGTSRRGFSNGDTGFVVNEKGDGADGGGR